MTTQQQDRELLELAAKAAGLKFAVNGEDLPGYVVASNGDWRYGWCYWNPLINDGAALRLAVKLEIEIRVFNGTAHAGKQNKFWRTEHWFPDGDVNAATRRAIVRAAAAIGRTTP